MVRKDIDAKIEKSLNIFSQTIRLLDLKIELLEIIKSNMVDEIKPDGFDNDIKQQTKEIMKYKNEIIDIEAKYKKSLNTDSLRIVLGNFEKYRPKLTEAITVISELDKGLKTLENIELPGD